MNLLQHINYRVMKLTITSIILSLSLFSCVEEKYPKYIFTEITYIPDSLKKDHYNWITETIRASSQQMTGGRYKNVDETIRQAKITADEIFGLKEMGLRRYDRESFYGIDIRIKDMSPEEYKIYNNLKLEN